MLAHYRCNQWLPEATTMLHKQPFCEGCRWQAIAQDSRSGRGLAPANGPPVSITFQPRDAEYNMADSTRSSVASSAAPRYVPRPRLLRYRNMAAGNHGNEQGHGGCVQGSRKAQHRHARMQLAMIAQEVQRMPLLKDVQHRTRAANSTNDQRHQRKSQTTWRHCSHNSRGKGQAQSAGTVGAPCAAVEVVLGGKLQAYRAYGSAGVLHGRHQSRRYFGF